MAKRRLQKILDLSGANNTSITSRDHEQNNIPNFADIISSSTIVFDENFCIGENFYITINSDICIDNELLALPIDNSLYYSPFNNNHDENDQNILTEESENINNVEIVSGNELEYNADVITLPFEINSPTIEKCILENNNIDTIGNQEVEQKIKSNNNRNIKPKPDVWKRKTSQNMRMNGNDYIGYQRKGNVVSQDVTRSARKIQPTCISKFCKKSKNRFCDTFEENQRLEIFSSFWKASWDEKKAFVSSIVTIIKTKRDTTGSTENSRRSNTYLYHLKYQNSPPLPVCKKMFIGTIGIKECMLHNWVKGSFHGLPKKNIMSSYNNILGEIVEISPQGKARRASFDVRLQHIKIWFNTLPKMPSHYCRKRTDKLYLEGPFNSVQEVFNCYKQKCIDDQLLPFSMCFFSQYMKENKLSIFIPKNDQCDLCSSYNNFQVSEEEYAEHMAFKNRAREEKENDKKKAQEKNCYCFTIDMQAVKLCPSLKVSSLYYSMKLKCHNYTIYNIATGECTNYWWHEGEAELEASVFSTILIKHLIRKCTENLPIIIYSDGCGYQNRNCVMSNALLQYSIHKNVVIEQKFLIKGHTQMECDSAHSLIERKIKNKDIYLPSDFIRSTTEARVKPYPFEAFSLTHSYFMILKI